MAKTKRVKNADGSYTIAGKAQNGEGTLYWHEAKQRYIASYLDPHTNKQRTVSAKTKTEVEARRKAKLQQLADHKPGSVVSAEATFSEFGDWWLENRAPEQARPNTLRTYRQDLGRLNKHIGTVQLKAVTPALCQQAIAAIRNDPDLSHGSAVNARARLRQILEAAFVDELIGRNPATAITTPKRTEEERAAKRTLTAEELSKLLAVLNAMNRYDAALGLLFTTGMRCSEALGLAWSDVDLEAGTVKIQRACTYEPTLGCRLDEPKTPRSAGSLNLHPRAIELLKHHKAIQNAEKLAAGIAWPTHTYEGREIQPIFLNTAGQLTREQIVGKSLKVAMVRAKIDDPCSTTHMARRTLVTLLSEQGVAVDAIAGFVGHSSPETTRRYIQNTKDRDARTTELAHAIIDQTAQKVAK